MLVQLQLDKMTVAEKLEAMELLWADLSRNESNIPVQEWHKSVLDERELLIKEGKAQFSSWEEAKKRLSEKHL